MKNAMVGLALVAAVALGAGGNAPQQNAVPPNVTAQTVLADGGTFNTLRVTGNAFVGGTIDAGSIVSNGALTSRASSGQNAFSVATQGARIDFGPGTADHCVANADETISCATALRLSSNSALYLNGTTGTRYFWHNATNDALELNGQARLIENAALATCSESLEGTLSRDVLSGVATGKRTKLCLCTSSGASVYAWQNVATGTLGTTTTCGTE